MANLKRVLYHNGNEQVPSELFVLSENADKTVNLSRDGKEAIVTGVQILAEAKPGHATAFPEAEESDDAKAEKKTGGKGAKA